MTRQAYVRSETAIWLRATSPLRLIACSALLLSFASLQACGPAPQSFTPQKSPPIKPHATYQKAPCHKLPNYLEPCSRFYKSCVAMGVWGCTEDGKSLRCTADISLIPKRLDICNNKDDDCDGQIDEDVSTPSHPDTKPRRTCWQEGSACWFDGSILCVAGEMVCVKPKDVCDGRDNDCDGEIDEDAKRGPCHNGPSTGLCMNGHLRCVKGEMHCQNNQERCNGIDDDCDGRVDENFPRLGQRCDVKGKGCDLPGKFVCHADQRWAECRPLKPPTQDLCDGKDDDCDGIIDNKDPRVGRPCPRTDRDPLCSGVFACEGDRLRCVHRKEDCNGQDDDCDGAIDEGLQKQACYTGALGTKDKGNCRGGVRHCLQATWTPCLGERTPSEERCNGKDDDCDGQVDEAEQRFFAYKNHYGHECHSELGCACQTQKKGRCKEGRFVCEKGKLFCKSLHTKVAETCNGKDDDCDGIADNTKSLELCNGVDDNCNGKVDEGIPGRPCKSNCGRGKRVCRQGRWICEGALKPTQERCNGKDDDCDGITDEGCATRTYVASDISIDSYIDFGGDNDLLPRLDAKRDQVLQPKKKSIHKIDLYTEIKSYPNLDEDSPWSNRDYSRDFKLKTISPLAQWGIFVSIYPESIVLGIAFLPAADWTQGRLPHFPLTGAPRSYHFTADEHTLVLRFRRHVEVWDLMHPKRIATLAAQQDDINAVHLHPTKQALFYCTRKQCVEWHYDKNSVEQSIALPQDTHATYLSPTGHYLAIRGPSSLSFVALHKQQKKLVLPLPQKTRLPRSSFAFHPSQDLFVMIDERGKVVAWNLATHKSQPDFLPLRSKATQLLFHPKGRMLLVAGQQQSELWDWSKRQRIQSGLPGLSQSSKPKTYVQFMGQGYLLIICKTQNSRHQNCQVLQQKRNACRTGFALSQGRCYNIQRHAKHCGKIGKDCKLRGQVCRQGQCTCRKGEALCQYRSGYDYKQACFDIRSGEANCGKCGSACPWFYDCIRGKCVPNCEHKNCDPYSLCDVKKHYPHDRKECRSMYVDVCTYGTYPGGNLYYVESKRKY